MKVLVIPRWYPSEMNINSGIFFKVQNEIMYENSIEIAVLYSEITSLTNYINKKKYKDKILNYKDMYSRMITIPRIIPRSIKHNQLLHYLTTLYMFQKYVKLYGLPDIIQAHVTKLSGETAIKIGKKYKIPVVITEHHSELIIKNYNIDKQIEECSQFVCVSNYLKSKIGNKNTIVIPNFIKDRKIIADKDDNIFTIVTVTNMTKNKNTILLLRAMTHLNSFNDIKLKIIGEGSEGDNLKKFISENELKNVELLGKLDNEKTLKEIASSDLLISTSFTETFGVSILEAISQGIPVISTNSGGPLDIINDRNGIILPDFEVTTLNTSILKIKNKEINFNKNLIISDYKKNFSSKSVVARYIDLYINILEKEKRK